MEGCNKVVQYDGLCVGHGGYRKCLSLNCEKRALANSYCQAHGGNSMCHIAGCRKRAIRGGICSDHKTQMPLHAARTNAAYARGRPSIDLQETPFKVEPTELSRPALDQCRFPTAATKSSQELSGPSSTYSRMSLAADMESTRTGEHVLSPLQYVRKGASALLDEGRTMVTPIAKHFNAGERYDPYHPQRRNLPVLPSFQTLQRSCNSSPWSEGSEMEWSSSASTPSRSMEDSPIHEQALFQTPVLPRSDAFVVSLGRACAHMCSVTTCSRHTKRSGLCLLHSIVSMPK
jgi:hypothetical protein